MSNQLFSRWNGAAPTSSIKKLKYFLVKMEDIMNYHKNKAYLPIKLSDKTIQELDYHDYKSFSDSSRKVRRICCISDTHESHTTLEIPKCDLLIHSGDILMRSRMITIEEGKDKLELFNEWLGKQPAYHKIVIPGNHDIVIQRLGIHKVKEILSNANYLCNSNIDLLGMKIWGFPSSEGNSNNRAFQSDEFQKSSMAQINLLENEQIDILITHGSCKSIGQILKPKIAHISGHYHLDHGVQPVLDGLYWSEISKSWLSISAPIMDGDYKATQAPIVMDLVLD